MKKIYGLICMVCVMLTVCSCGIKDEPIYGTYNTVGIFEDTYTINQNKSYDAKGTTPDINYAEKGTFVENETSFELQPTKSGFMYTKFIKVGNYYCEEGSCFTKDVEYGLKPTFDESGRTNQTFEDKITNGLIFPNRNHKFTLSLKDDGTCTGKFEITVTRVNNTGNILADLESMQTETLKSDEFMGTYEYKDSILTITYDGKTYPMPVSNEKIYFYTLEKIKAN